MQSHDVIGSNTQKIAQLFPNCVTERLGKDGKPELAIDFEKLQAELSNEIIAEGEERYQFTWPDKRAAIRLANTPTTMTLRPCRKESVDFDNTQNLYIEGDNLDVLKILRENYLGKVKMIYIDPPYNTGNDFVYNDDFGKDKGSFEETSGLFDDEGNQTIDPMQRNTESNGRFHTDWLKEDVAPITELVPAGKKDIHGDFGAYCYQGFRHSLCHGWASGPTAWLSQHVLGVEIVEPGYKVVRINPNLGNLEWVEGAVPTPYGDIKISHRKDADGKVVSKVDAPSGVTVIM